LEKRSIQTEANYKTALQEISVLMDIDPDMGTPEGDPLDILVALVQAYEAEQVSITVPDQDLLR
jgi:HTH-type transcriptional regulator/antitoxin HigA